MEEVWKDIPNYEGIYQASSFGRIRSCADKKTYSVRSGERRWKQRILKPKSCANMRHCGYRVTLWKDKKPKDFLVARLVCTTFHENLIDTKMTVNHKDGDRLNNHIDNLEWLSLADNIRHGYENNLYKAQDETVLTSEATGESKTFRSQSQASQYLGRNHGYISNLAKKNSSIATSKNGERFIFVVQKHRKTYDNPEILEVEK